MAAKKKDCECKVVEVDDGDEQVEGWECKCFEIAGRRMASARGPGWQSWSPITGGGSDSKGNPFGQATNPATGDAYEVHYKCTCKRD